MELYEVRADFSISGKFAVMAESAQAAEQRVRENCGLCLGGKIHSTLPDNELDWNFPVHFEIATKEAVRAEKGNGE